MSEPSTGREAVIQATERAVMSDRNADYAPPEQNFQRIADLWNLYLEGRSTITPYDTAIMMVLVKVARIQQSPHLLDHLVDIAGYAACAADVIPPAPGTEPAPAPAPEQQDAAFTAVYEGKPAKVRVSDGGFVFLFTDGGKTSLTDEQFEAGVAQGVIVVGGGA